MSQEYDEYLREHCTNVQRAQIWLYDNIDLGQLPGTGFYSMIHDESKLSDEEYRPYDEYFYGGNKSYEVKKNFDYAWLHHIHHNPHHWQYWVLMEDDPENGERFKALEMPKEYVIEMIADWWSFSWKQGNLREIFKWYNDHKKNIILHPETRKMVEDILKKIKAVLDMQDRVQGKEVEDRDEMLEHSDDDEDSHIYGIPELKKYPMPDRKHVKSAIKFFNYVDSKHEKELADAILERMDEYNMSFEDINVGDENRFKKYLPKDDHLEHHGIEGQKWGERNGPPYPINSQLLNKTPAKIEEINNYDGKLYWLSERDDLEGQLMTPKVPKNYFTENGYEDNQTERLWFSPSIDESLSGNAHNITGKTYTVYEPEDPVTTVYKPNKGAVPDAEITGELWVKDPVILKPVARISVTGRSNQDSMKFDYGDFKAERHGWEWNYEWKADEDE